MKLNFFQKIIALIYCALFLYFSLFHVPFILSEIKSIKYDTLFSNNADLDISRLVAILIIITIISIGLLFLAKNIEYKYSPPTEIQKKAFTYIALVTSTLVFIFWGLSPFFNTNNKSNDVNTNSIDTKRRLPSFDSAAPASDATNDNNMVDYLEKKNQTCNEEQVRRDFDSYMKFNYPDWKIYGNPIIQVYSDCTYRIQFTTMNPKIRYEKEIIIVEIAYTPDLEHYNFRTIRGVLY